MNKQIDIYDLCILCIHIFITLNGDEQLGLLFKFNYKIIIIIEGCGQMCC